MIELARNIIVKGKRSVMFGRQIISADAMARQINRPELVATLL
jgi:hypothetical protein